MRTTLGHAYSRSMTSTVDVVGVMPSASSASDAVGESAAVHDLHHVLGDRRAEHVRQPSRDRPLGTDHRQRDAPTAQHRLQAGDRARRDDVDRIGRGDARAAATNARAASASSTTVNGGSASTLNGTAGWRSSRPSGLGTCGPEHRRQPQRAHGDADALAGGAGGVLEALDHAAVLGRRMRCDASRRAGSASAVRRP